MKIAVRYQSKGGNTKAVAEKIAELAGVKAESIDKPIDEPVDILFIGGAVYAFSMDSTLKSYLQNLEPKTVKSAAAFCTGMKMSIAGKISVTLKQKGISTAESKLSIKGVKSGALSEAHLKQIEGFVKASLS